MSAFHHTTPIRSSRVQTPSHTTCVLFVHFTSPSLHLTSPIALGPAQSGPVRNARPCPVLLACSTASPSGPAPLSKPRAVPSLLACWAWPGLARQGKAEAEAKAWHGHGISRPGLPQGSPVTSPFIRLFRPYGQGSETRFSCEKFAFPSPRPTNAAKP